MDIADKKRDRDRDRAATGLGGNFSAALVSRYLLAVFAAFVLADAAISTTLPRYAHARREEPYFFEALGKHFAKSPGAWNLRAYEPGCDPQPLAEQLIDGSDAGRSSGRLVGIMYGDSVDRTLVDNFCKLAHATLESEPESPGSKRYKSVTWCMTDRFLLMHSWTNGLHPARAKIQVQSPEQAFNQSRQKLVELTGRQAPDVVMIASCMWDVTHWMHNRTWWPNRGDPDSGASAYLGQERLGQYMTDLQGYIAMVKDGFGSDAVPFMATRTMPLWNPRSLLAFDNLDGKVTGKDELRLPPGHSRQLLWNNYIAAVNAALRHASRQMALPVIDFEAIAIQLPEAHLHAADGFHPDGKLLATVLLNLLLNEYEAAAPAVASSKRS